MAKQRDMAPPGPIEEPALAWLDSGLYKLLFNVSVKNAVINAENKLSKVSDAQGSCTPTTQCYLHPVCCSSTTSPAYVAATLTETKAPNILL